MYNYSHFYIFKNDTDNNNNNNNNNNNLDAPNIAGLVGLFIFLFFIFILPCIVSVYNKIIIYYKNKKISHNIDEPLPYYNDLSPPYDIQLQNITS
jgi:hypothetical protein